MEYDWVDWKVDSWAELKAETMEYEWVVLLAETMVRGSVAQWDVHMAA